jgi:hypothetical protein
MWDNMLFLSFFNLLAMLPLFAAWRLGENLENGPPGTFWEQLISSPPLLCLGVIFISGYLAWRIAEKGEFGESMRRPLMVNFSLMFLLWVLPRAFQLDVELQRAAIESWTVAVAVIMLLVSLRVPFQAAARALREKRSGDSG